MSTRNITAFALVTVFVCITAFAVVHAEDPAAGATQTIAIVCPASMLSDPGGQFEYLPGRLSNTISSRKITTAETAPFCIDESPAASIATYAAAEEFCRARDKHLCSFDELRKVCATWPKPLPCPRDVEAAGNCPDTGARIRKFRDTQEWAAQTDANGDVETGSCGCNGAVPVCIKCMYPGCRSAKKAFRCCSGPLPVEPPHD